MTIKILKFDKFKKNFFFFQFSKTWLLKEITKTSSVNLGVSDEDYYNNIIEMLSSQKSDTELQDEVCILIVKLFLINGSY